MAARHSSSKATPSSFDAEKAKLREELLQATADGKVGTEEYSSLLKRLEKTILDSMAADKNLNSNLSEMAVEEIRRKAELRLAGKHGKVPRDLNMMLDAPARAFASSREAIAADIQTVSDTVKHMKLAQAGDKAHPVLEALEASLKELVVIRDGFEGVPRSEWGGAEAAKLVDKLREASVALETALARLETETFADEGDRKEYEKLTGAFTIEDHAEFADPRGSNVPFTSLPLYGQANRTMDRGYPVPPVGADQGLLMEDPTQMDPRINKDLPYTIDDSEGVIVLHFHKGPYKGQELVLASMSPTIEWVVPSPPPLHLFDESPIVKEHPPEWEGATH